MNAGYSNNARFANPTCNCLGCLGAGLGGGLTRTAGLYGWVVDQLQSVNLVLASGEAVNVSSTNEPDLWWVLRGAAPNFGVVTSTVVSAYPMPQAVNVAWQSRLTFADDKLKDLISTINTIDLAPHMQIDFLLSTSGPPAYKPMISAIAFFLGNASEAEKAWAPVLKIGSLSNSTNVLPYMEWGAWSDTFCAKGDRKPVYTVCQPSSSKRLNLADRLRIVQDLHRDPRRAAPKSATPPS